MVTAKMDVSGGCCSFPARRYGNSRLRKATYPKPLKYTDDVFVLMTSLKGGGN
jgi:hypothetical protein